MSERLYKPFVIRSAGSGGVAISKQIAKVYLAGLMCLYSAHVIAGPDEWQMHMDAALEAFVASDYSKAAKHYEAAVREALNLGEHDARLAESLNSLAGSVAVSRISSPSAPRKTGLLCTSTGLSL